jgi:hypothetical protein
MGALDPKEEVKVGALPPYANVVGCEEIIPYQHRVAVSSSF